MFVSKISKAVPLFKIWYAYCVLRPQLLKSYPANVVIELTDRCNLRCEFCPRGQRIGGDMDFDLFKKIIDEVKNVKEIILVGIGEPLMYPYLIKAIEYVKDTCDSKVSIITNGVLLTKDIGRELIDSGLDSLTVSINYSPARYSQATKSEKYMVVEHNTREFLQMLNRFKRKPNTLIQILETANTDKEIDAFIRYWKPYLSPNAKIHIQPLINWGGVVNLNRKSNKSRRNPCGLFQSSWTISREGDVFPCCVALGYEKKSPLLLGNVKDNTLGELFSKGKIESLRELDIEGRLDYIIPCASCDTWEVHPNIWFWNPVKRVWQ